MSLAKGPCSGCLARAQRSLGRHRSVYLVPCPLNGNKRRTNNARLCIKPPVFFLNCSWTHLCPRGHHVCRVKFIKMLKMASSYHKSTLHFNRRLFISHGHWRQCKGQFKSHISFAACVNETPHICERQKGL